jgi:hypothetical protein
MPNMSLDEALVLLPEGSPYRTVLRGMVSTDAALRGAADGALRSLARSAWETQTPIAEATAVAVLRAVLELPFPPPRTQWDRAPGQIVFSLIGSAHPPVVDLIEARFGEADERIRLDLLALLASAATRRGAEVFASLVARYGWPQRPYARFFGELGTNLPHADALFPALLEAPGAPSIELGDLLLRALRGKTLDPGRVADAPMVRDLAPRIDALLARSRELRGRARDDVDPDDAAQAVRRELVMLLDLAGFVGGDLRDTLRAATELPDTWPAAFAVVSTLRRNGEVESATIARIASDHATRAAFYSLLRELGATERIPAELRSRDAFAAADMVEWLSHAGELGRPPEALEKMAVFEARRSKGEHVLLYVWRFRVADRPWLASFSGPYPASGREGPLHGSDTFSRFERWDAMSAEKHALAILKNLTERRRAWAERSPAG